MPEDESRDRPKTMEGLTLGGWIGIALMLLVVLGGWIWGLARMAACGGVGTAYFWVAFLLFVFVPFVGPLTGFVMAVTAIGALWRPGRRFAGMQSPGI